MDSYIFGYPLVLMTMARATANDGHGLVVNTLRHAVPPPTPGSTAQITPDVDTVHSTAWIDLTDGPIVLALPDVHDRYLNARVLDMWTNSVWSTAPLADSRNRSVKARTIALVPPGWAGTLPPDIERVDAPSKYLWLSVRIGGKVSREMKGARRVQHEMRLAPLAAWLAGDRKSRETGGKAKLDERDGDTPNAYADAPGSQIERVAALDAKTFFSRLADALPDNPPTPPDAHALQILADIGVKPGEPVHLPERAAGAVEQGVAEARARLASPPINALSANGWFWLGDDIGHYEDDYNLRAFAASTRGGIGTRNDEVRPTARVDSTGQVLDGANRYLLHFPAKGLPPARAFWTLTAYTPNGSLGDTDVPRRSIASVRDRPRRNPDGSLDIWMSSTNPGRAHEANWLPVPKGPFQLVMRIYTPQPEATDGSWQPPAVVRQ